MGARLIRIELFADRGSHCRPISIYSHLSSKAFAYLLPACVHPLSRGYQCQCQGREGREREGERGKEGKEECSADKECRHISVSGVGRVVIDKEVLISNPPRSRLLYRSLSTQAETEAGSLVLIVSNCKLRYWKTDSHGSIDYGHGRGSFLLCCI